MLYGFATCVPAVLVVVFVNRNSQSLLEKTPRADLRAATSGTIGAFVSKENRLGGHGAQYIEYGTLRSDIGLHITRLYCQKKAQYSRLSYVTSPGRGSQPKKRKRTDLGLCSSS